jgi:hypothetical protein
MRQNMSPDNAHCDGATHAMMMMKKCWFHFNIEKSAADYPCQKGNKRKFYGIVDICGLYSYNLLFLWGPFKKRDTFLSHFDPKMNEVLSSSRLN